MNTSKIFESLPHVNVIWVDGEIFHLHPNNGGEEIHRDSVIEPLEVKNETGDSVIEPLEVKKISKKDK